MKQDDLSFLLHLQLQPQECLLWYAFPEWQQVKNHFSLLPRRYQVLWGFYGFLSLVGGDLALLKPFLSALPHLIGFSVLLLGSCTLLYLRYLSSVCTKRHRLTQTIYGITNQRMIVVSSPGRLLTIYSFSPSTFGTISIIEDRDGWREIVFGPQRLCRRFRLEAVTNVNLLCHLLLVLHHHHHQSEPTSPRAMQNMMRKTRENTDTKNEWNTMTGHAALAPCQRNK